jgi:hypothetical protein
MKKKKPRINKDKLQKEYIKQLANQINNYSGCKFDYRLTKECILIAAFLAVEKLSNEIDKSHS